MSIFTEIGLVIILAAVLGFFARLIKQPLILAYIFAGVILGPSVFNIIKSQDMIHYFSSLGIAFLLFTIGLELDIRKLKKFSLLIVTVGFGQVFFTGLSGFILSYAFGFSPLPALYLGLALTFSSTAVVVKLLSDNKELDSLQGKFIIGTMLIQDLVALLALILLQGLDLSLSFEKLFIPILFVLLKGVIFLFASLLLGKYFVPLFFKFVSKSPELFFLISTAWCLVLIFFAQKIGLSLEIGAFLAGLGLASTPYNLEIVGKIKSLRDFFLILFFTSLGMQMNWHDLGVNWLLVLIFILFVVIGNPLIVWIFMGVLGFKKRVLFLTGIATSQISEFSIILIALGISLKHLDSSLISLITIVAMITMIISSYLITYDHKIYLKISKYLNIFEKKKLRFKDLLDSVEAEKNHIVLFGCDRMGSVILSALQKHHEKILVVDFNLEVIENLQKQGIRAFYGDIEDPEIIEKANLNSAKMIISTVPDFHANLFLLSQITNKNVVVYMTSEDVKEAEELYAKGVDYVILPLRLSGEHVALLLNQLGENKQGIAPYREKHIQELQKTAA